MEERRRENLAALIRLETEVESLQNSVDDHKKDVKN